MPLEAGFFRDVFRGRLSETLRGMFPFGDLRFLTGIRCLNIIAALRCARWLSAPLGSVLSNRWGGCGSAGRKFAYLTSVYTRTVVFYSFSIGELGYYLKQKKKGKVEKAKNEFVFDPVCKVCRCEVCVQIWVKEEKN